MKKIYLFTLLIGFTLSCFAGALPAPYYISKPKKKKDPIPTSLQIGGGIMGSVLYLSRNIKENNDAKGLTIIANYSGRKLYRLSAQFTHYFPVNIEPTWYSITANTVEANLEVMARFPNDQTILYPFAGFSYNTFKGYFTGTNDYLNLREIYQANTTVQSQWLGLNIGTGIEHAFGPVVLFGDYKMRIGREQNGGFNIMDVCYSAGLRFKISIYAANPGNRYHHYRSNIKKRKTQKR